MRQVIGCAVFWSVLSAPAILSQEPAPPKLPSAPVPAAEAPALVPAPIPSVAAPSEPVNTPGWVAADIFLGQQMGLRAQVSVYRHGPVTYVAEGFYGALLTRFGASEAMGGGARALFCRASRDGNNTLLLAPGLNVLYQVNEDGLVLLAPSVELSWLHGFGGGGGWEIGLSAGLGIGVAGGTRHRDDVGQVTPLISLYSGFRF
jgi:hypothetical protein